MNKFPKSTQYKLVNAETDMIVAEGSCKAMTSQMKKLNKFGPRHYIGLTSRPVGSKWPRQTEDNE